MNRRLRHALIPTRSRPTTHSGSQAHQQDQRWIRAKDPRIDLLNWTSEQLRLMPPTVVSTDERDVLRSQGEQFAKNLEAAGVTVTGTRYDHVMHEFSGASAVLDAAEQAQQQAADHFREACGTGGDTTSSTEQRGVAR